MPYPVGSGAIIELACEYTQAGQKCLNLFHYYMEKEGGIDNGRASALSLMAWFRGAGGQLDAYRGCMWTGIDDILLSAQWITPVRHAYIIDPAGPVAGQQLGDVLPVNVQISLTLRGEDADRHNIGRKEMGGVIAAFLTGSNLNAVGRTPYEDFCETLTTEHIGPEGEQYTHVIFNRQTPELSPEVFEAFPQTSSRVTRRRTVGVGQ